MSVPYLSLLPIPQCSPRPTCAFDANAVFGSCSSRSSQLPWVFWLLEGLLLVLALLLLSYGLLLWMKQIIFPGRVFPFPSPSRMIFQIVGPCVGLSHLSLWGCAAHLFVSFTAIHCDGRRIMVVCFLRVCLDC